MQMICENEGIPRLVYVSRERRPTYHHLKQAMCFYVDDTKTYSSSSSLAFVQLPQMFYNLSQNDIYDGQARSDFKVCTFSFVLALIFFFIP
ncbi:hypothetical protein MKW92_028371 [Papaver armeniacum]|nr:hypothetical protein MKW92_028371 [Papaver armeniacum]